MSEKELIPLNTQLEFEQRVLNPSKYPVLNNEDGSHSTHSMAWSDFQGKYVAYPTVVMLGKSLQRLPDDFALVRAIETGQFRQFETPEEAEEYSTQYKRHWGQGEKTP